MDKTPPKSVNAYIARFPKPTQKLLQHMRAAIAKVAPNATEKIGYGMPTFVLNGNLVHYAAYERHIGFYPGAAGIAQFADALAQYKHAKGSVQFPLDAPLPLALVKRIVKFRVAQNMELRRRSAPASSES
jgi:uncharacterized protein YdhG (YjbR/CyaY superfamily)